MFVHRLFPKAAPWRRAAALVVVVAFSVTLVPGAALAKGPPWARSGDGDRAWMPHGLVKKLGWLFPDVAEAAWAAPYVAELQYLGILKGEGGLLQPNRAATRLEVIITALRLLGLESDATQLDAAFRAAFPGWLRARDTDKENNEDAADEAGAPDEAVSRFLARTVPKAVMKHAPGWALGYVLLAIRQGLIVPEGRLNLVKPASRLEAAVILVRALGKDAEARARAGEALEFTDAAQVPAGAAGYVRIAVEEGILNGYPDGSLRPNKPITRAELAAVLSRLAGGRIPASWLTGTLVSVTAGDAPAMTVRRADGTEASYPVLADAPVFLDNRAATLADLRPGDHLRLYLDAGGRVLLIRATVPKSAATGTIAALSTAAGGGLDLTLHPESGPDATYGVGAGVPVYEGTQARRLGDLRVGLRVKLSLERNTVVRIDILSSVSTTTGSVVATGNDAFGRPAAITLQLSGGTQATYAVSPTVEVRLAGTPVTFADVRAGDRATLTFDTGTVVKIDLAARAETVTGWVYGTATNAFGHPAQITLRDAAGALATYGVSGSVEVYEGTTAVAWSSLRAHDKVALDRTSGTVTRITVLARAETFAGTITALDATAQAFTVQQLAADGVTTVFRSFAVTADTYMVGGSTAIGFGDLALGRPVFVAAHAVSGVWQAVYVELR